MARGPHGFNLRHEMGFSQDGAAETGKAWCWLKRGRPVLLVTFTLTYDAFSPSRRQGAHRSDGAENARASHRDRKHQCG